MCSSVLRRWLANGAGPKDLRGDDDVTKHLEQEAAPPIAGEEREPNLRWWDGFTISLAIPAALFIGMGAAIGAIGGWTALVILATVATIACLQNFIYSEVATMFPRMVGGIAAYANEAWRRRSTIVGPLAAFGYWFAWSSSLGVYGLQIGYLAQAQWFPDQTWSFSTGLADVGFPHIVGLGVMIVGWALNVVGLRLAMWVMYVTGAILLVPVLVFALAPFFSGEWDINNLQWALGDSGFPGWQTFIAWAFVLAWTVFGVEAVSSFTPEYKKPVSDTRRALRVSGIFVLFVFILVPLGVGGLAKREDVIADPVAFYLGLFDKLMPGGSLIVTVCLIAGLLLMMLMTYADTGRVLEGSARSGLTIKQLGVTNRFGMPARASTLDLIFNIFLIFFVGGALAIVTAGITGYILCHILALSGFLLLRKDRPKRLRPVKLSRIWVVIASVLLGIDVVLFVIGLASGEITGYGGPREIIIAVFVLALSLVLFYIRRVVQDRKKFVWRDPEPLTAEDRGERDPEAVGSLFPSEVSSAPPRAE
ncbi:amino acid/polyamine/organocation transporter (APC superfamily) [Leucobacter luti]|uniref:Amino acid/polyamine/organocation transporter (APC superfamily) n=1 Tax=Leucobacter luti TaxID=340320 RepID=A0A4R6RWR1_9MICO|nr:amino acid/polyamine/organocation transporter (APC superfamily) [Leucobacter luti]